MRGVVTAVLISTITVSLFAMNVDAQRRRRQAPQAQLQQDLGGVEWGWTRQRLLRHFREQIEDRYRPLLAKAPGAIEEDTLRRQMGEEVALIRESYFEFNGRTSGHDSGYLRSEFTHNNGEAMMRVQTDNANDYYFFINNHLWKRYRAYDSSAFGDVDFDTFAGVLENQYGPGRRHRGKLSPDDDHETQWVEWEDRTTRARAIDNTRFYGMYCLVFEEKATLARLDQLRTNASTNRGQDGHRMVESVMRDGDDDAADPNADVADRISGQTRRVQQAGD